MEMMKAVTLAGRLVGTLAAKKDYSMADLMVALRDNLSVAKMVDKMVDKLVWLLVAGKAVLKAVDLAAMMAGTTDEMTAASKAVHLVL